MIICQRRSRRIERCKMHVFALIFLPKLAHAAARFVCDSWPTCYNYATSPTLPKIQLNSR